MSHEIGSAIAFRDVVLLSEKPVLVDFWGTSCGPCRMMAPIIEDIATGYRDHIEVAKVNVETCPELADTFNVKSVPTFAVFVGGTVVKRLVGAKSRLALFRELREYLGPEQI